MPALTCESPFSTCYRAEFSTLSLAIDASRHCAAFSSCQKSLQSVICMRRAPYAGRRLDLLLSYKEASLVDAKQDPGCQDLS